MALAPLHAHRVPGTALAGQAAPLNAHDRDRAAPLAVLAVRVTAHLGAHRTRAEAASKG